MKVYFDTCEQQIPLYLRLDTRHLWPEIQQALGLDHKKHAPIAAAIYENSLAGSATSYSRRNVPARNGDCNGILTRKNIIGCVDRLEQLGFVENMVQCPGGRGWRSAARGNNALALLMQTIIPDTGSIPFVMPQRAAIIRDADGQEIPPTNRAAFERIEKPIWAVNEMLQGTDIRDGKGFDIRTPMRRVFNRDTHHGGRLYGMGSIGWQNIPRDERHDTTINGEPTIELDFKAIHPHILYSERGHPIPSDCYDVGNWPRDLVKLALLVLINAETLGEVVTVLANSDGEKITRDEEGGIIDVTTERRLMKQIAGNDYSKAMAFAHKLVQDVKDHHAPIADDFHTGAGIRLMNKDSEIAMHVLTSLTKMGEPVLAVHDSFLVRSSVKDKLEEVMHHAAAKAGLMNIKIEAKTRH